MTVASPPGYCHSPWPCARVRPRWTSAGSGWGWPRSAAPATSTSATPATWPARPTSTAMRAPRPRGARRGVGGRRALLRRGPLLRPRRGVPRLVADRPRAFGRGEVTRRFEVGLHVHRRTGASTPRSTRSRTCRSTRCAARRPRPGRCSATRSALYQIHSATIESGVLEDRAVLDELARLRAGGLRHRLHVDRPAPGRDDRAGGGRPAPSTRAGDVEPAGPSAGPALAAAQRRRARGDHQGGGGQRPADRARRRPGAGRRWRGSWASTPDALALACVLAQPWVDVVLSGASTVPMLAPTSARSR